MSSYQNMIRTKKNKKLVTVYMPVFNASKYLSQAIESILNQTYSNFEFIIIDDASTDNSWKIIRSYAKKDKRIIAIKNKINLGVSLTSNIAISQAKGKYLARMDADDISLFDRLEKQLNYFKNHPETIAIGGQCIVIDGNDHIIGSKNFPIDPNKLKEMIFWAIPMQQPSMMINIQKLPKKFNWYSPSDSSAEEVNLMFKLMLYGQIANLSDNLLFYRNLDTSLSHKNPKETFKLTLNSRFHALDLGFRPSAKAIILNICQIIVISLLPGKVINEIWSKIRGINLSSKAKYNLTDDSYVKA